MVRASGCELCIADGGLLIARSDRWRLVRVDDADFPAYYRVIWNDHVAELSDLTRGDRVICLDVVAAVERVLRERLRPTKVNLAALGNVVPHLHWHVIARFDWDSRFPRPIWAAPLRQPDPPPSARLGGALASVDADLRTALADMA